jgi:hypothetical protein
MPAGPLGLLPDAVGVRCNGRRTRPDALEVPTTEDQHPIKALTANGADQALGGGIGPRSLARSADDSDTIVWVPKSSSKLAAKTFLVYLDALTMWEI